jgi:outer membrane protein assembly factor BamB
VAAYEVRDGSARWGTPSPAVSAVIVSGAVVATDGTTMSGFDAQTGTTVWSGTFAGDQVVAAGEDVVAVGPDAICSFVARTGVENWCGGPALSAVADGTTLYAVGDGTLTAISLATGDTRWGRSFANGWAVSTSLWRPVVADGIVYAVGYHFDGAGGQRHELFAVRAGDGGQPHQVPFDLDAERGGEPLVAAGGQVYFAGLNAVYAFGAPAL